MLAPLGNMAGCMTCRLPCSGVYMSWVGRGESRPRGENCSRWMLEPLDRPPAALVGPRGGRFIAQAKRAPVNVCRPPRYSSGPLKSGFPKGRPRGPRCSGETDSIARAAVPPDRPHRPPAPRGGHGVLVPLQRASAARAGFLDLVQKKRNSDRWFVRKVGPCMGCVLSRSHHNPTFSTSHHTICRAICSRL